MQRFLILIGLFMLGLSLVNAQSNLLRLEQLNAQLDSLDEQQEVASFLSIAQRATALAAEEYGKVDSNYIRQHFREIEAYKAMGELPKALGLLQKSLEDLKNNYGESSDLYIDLGLNLQELYIYKGLFDKALKLLEKLEAKITELHGRKSQYYIDLLRWQMVVWVYQGDFEKAVVYNEQEKKVLEHLDRAESEDYVSAINNLAYIYEALGQTDAAEQLYLDSKLLRAKLYGKESTEYGVILSNLGLLYMRTGRYARAETVLRESVVLLSRKAKNREQYLSALHNLATLQDHQGQIKEAKKTFETIVAAYADMDYSVFPESNRFLTENNLANIYMELGDWKKAVAIFQKQLREAMTRESRLRALQGLVKVALQQPDYNQAAGYLQRLEALQQGHRQWDLAIGARTWRLWGSYFMAQKDYAASAKYLLRAIGELMLRTEPPLIDDLPNQLRAVAIGRSEEAVSVLRLLQELYERQYASTTDTEWLHRGLALAEATLEHIAKHSRDIVSPRDRIQQLNEQRFFTAKAIYNAWELGEQLSEKTYFQRAFFLSEQSKARLISAALQSEQARNLGMLPDSLAKQEKELKNRQGQLSSALFETQDTAKQQALGRKIDATAASLEALYARLKKEYPDYYRLRYALPEFPLEVLQEELSAKELLLSYFKTGSYLYSFELSRDSFRCIRQELEPKEWERHYKDYRQMLTSFDQAMNGDAADVKNLAKESHWWYQRLLAPTLEHHPGMEQLYILPDAEIHHLPFETFTTQPMSGKEQGYKDLAYAVKDYRMSYSYSVALWLEAQQHPEKKADLQLLALAPKHKDKTTEATTRAGLSPYLQNLRRKLLDLPAVREEVRKISKGLQGQTLIGADATERKVREIAKDYGVLHFATHGLLNEQYPILSSLALTQSADSLHDDFLQAHEIAQWELNAELVVLSACETGYGRFEQGEGVMSLARSFLYAQVPSLVVSLWQVNDNSTSEIMQSFYHYLSEGLDKSEALRQAKLDYIDNAESSQMAHPAFWAPLVQMGNSREVKLAKAQSFWSSQTVLLIATGLLAAVLGLWYWRRKA